LAKNLKLNIKNAQLAEALKLSAPKKAPAKKAAKQPKEEQPTEIVSEQKPERETISEPVAPEKIHSTETPKSEPKKKVDLSSEDSSPREARSDSDTEEKGETRPSYSSPEGSYPRRAEGSTPYSRRDPPPSYPPRTEGSTPYQRREGNSSYPPRTDGSSTYQRREGTTPYQPRSEGSAPYQRREGNSSYPPRTPYQGSGAPYQRREGATPYQPRPEGSASSQRREGNSSYPPRTPYQGNGAPYQRREGSNPYQPRTDGSSPYPRRAEGSAPYPRREGFTPRPPFRPGAGGDFRPRSPSLPPIKEPPKDIPQQQQQHHKKTTPHFNTEKDGKTLKKSSDGRTFDVRDRQGLRQGDDERWRKRKAIKTKQQLEDEIIRPKELKVRLPITVKDLAAAMKLKASQLVAKLFMQGVILTLNDYLDDETTVQLLGHEFECELTIDTSEEERIRVTGKSIKEEVSGTEESLLQLRPPIVTFMGHVDHGKTSLIDTIRKSNVAASEAGAITQHIGAFKCHTAVGVITILDTPGHEAFSSMRERGADVTDIVVLVVAGDEGIKTQTLEAIEQAKKAGVCLVVAINKCDKPNFDPETVYRQLADQNLLPEIWGGSVITVNCSATTGQGIKELLEMLALQAEVLELKTNPNTRARGVVIESEMHKGLGAVATILVQNGTLRLGDSLVFDQLYAKVKTMRDEHGKELLEAGPSTPVKITGLSGVPTAGSEFIVVKNEKEAKEISEKREGQKNVLLLQKKKASLENMLQDKADSKSKKSLRLILKADVQGSLEALKASLRKLPGDKVEITFIAEGVGEVSESDIQYAATSKATIIGFHTRVESHAESLIKQNKVDVRLHDIIYHAVDDVRELMTALLDKIPQENELGEALVRSVFKSSKIGNIAGCQVTDGLIRRNCQARLVRNKEVIWKGPIASLKRVKEDVKEISKGHECGIILQGFGDYMEDDRIQAYEIIYLEQELT